MTDHVNQVRIQSNKRIACTKWGPEPRLEKREASLDFKLIPGSIIINVKAASLSTLDTQLCRGFLKRKVSIRPPHGVGYDFSGVVTHIASATCKFKVGDAVFGCLPLNKPGAVAEHLMVSETYCSLKPDDISHAVACTLGWNCILAHSALSDMRVTLDDRLLVLGGTTGTGHLMIQLAK